MMIVDYIRSMPCCCFDPSRLVSPEVLRMVFIAGAVVSAVAALFAAYLSSSLMALPFVCSAGTSYLSSYLVERYFMYGQALENHGEVVRDLTAQLRTAGEELAQNAQRVVQRQQQNNVLQANIATLEATLPAVSAETQTFIANLQKQVGQLQGVIQGLNAQKVRDEETIRSLGERLEETERIYRDLRRENAAMRQLQAEQQRINEESQRRVVEVREGASAIHRLGEESVDAVERINHAAKMTVELQQQAEKQGEKLLKLRSRIEGQN